MLGGRMVKQLLELHGAGASIRSIAESLGISRNTVRKYLRTPELPQPAPRTSRESKLDPYMEHIRERLSEGIENCQVLLRELRQRGYGGGYTILKEFVRPLRRRPPVSGTMRFETAPGEQAQVDFGSCAYAAPIGGRRRVWAFTIVLSWSRMLYVEFVRRADTATFLRCHLHAFEYFGGLPQRCLYDRTKLVVLGIDAHGAPLWNARFLDFVLRLGIESQLCHAYRPQSKGRVESGIKYVKGNFWSGIRFTDLEDLNRQARVWCDTVANVRLHGTTHRPLAHGAARAARAAGARAAAAVSAGGAPCRARWLRPVGGPLVRSAVALAAGAGGHDRGEGRPRGALGGICPARCVSLRDTARTASDASAAMGGAYPTRRPTAAGAPGNSAARR
jgi:transposase